MSEIRLYKRLTSKQLIYLDQFLNGMTMKEIAELHGVHKSTVSRVIKKALTHECPFSPVCEDCPLPDCAIKEPYVQYVNTTEDVRSIRRSRTKPDAGRGGIRRKRLLVYQDRAEIKQYFENKETEQDDDETFGRQS